MQSDLAGAYAAVDWAVSQINILDHRINQWIESRPYIAVAEPDGDTAYDIIKVRFQGKPLPLVVNAEAGAIINMIHSSLDILMVALAERNGHVAPKDVYLPIADSVLSFIDPVYSYCVIELEWCGWFCAVHCSTDIAPGWLRGRRSGVGALS